MEQQLPFENDDRNFELASHHLKSLKTAYLPIENLSEYSKKMYTALMEIMTSDKSNEIK